MGYVGSDQASTRPLEVILSGLERLEYRGYDSAGVAVVTPQGLESAKRAGKLTNLLTELNREGTTIVMVTHSRHDASFAHRTVHLFDGSVVASVASNDL